MIERRCFRGGLWPLENIGVQKATWAAAGGKEAYLQELEAEHQDEGEDHNKDEEVEEENRKRESGGGMSMGFW